VHINHHLAAKKNMSTANQKILNDAIMITAPETPIKIVTVIQLSVAAKAA